MHVIGIMQAPRKAALQWEQVHVSWQSSQLVGSTEAPVSNPPTEMLHSSVSCSIVRSCMWCSLLSLLYHSGAVGGLSVRTRFWAAPHCLRGSRA